MKTRFFSVLFILTLLFAFSTGAIAQPANDSCDQATVVSVLPFADNVNTTTATSGPEDPITSCASGGGGNTVWYTFTATADVTVSANTFGSDYDTMLGLFTGTCGDLTEVACNDDAQGTQAEIIWTATAGVTYYVMVGEYAGAGNGGNLTFNFQESEPPSLYQGPEAGSISGGVMVSTNDFPTMAAAPSREKKSFKHVNPAFRKDIPNPPVQPLGPVDSNFIQDLSAGKPIPQAELPFLQRKFEGIPDLGVVIPPEPIMAAGPNHLIAAVNQQFAIFDKNGAMLQLINAEDWYNSVLPGTSPCDPQIVYDVHSGRWIMSWIECGGGATSLFLSVSDDSDPFGNWYNWRLPGDVNGSTTTGFFNDYPKMGIDADAIYVSANMFSFSFEHVQLRVIPKAQLLNNDAGPVTWQDLWDIRDPSDISGPGFTLVPAVTYGTPGVEYIVSVDFLNTTGNHMNLYTLSDPTGTPSLTGDAVAVTAFVDPGDAGQLGGGSPGINVGGRRNRNVVYKDGSVWTAHSTGDASNTYARSRYVRIDVATATASEDVAFGADGYWYFYPAIQPDASNNAAISFSRSATDEYAGAWFTGVPDGGSIQPATLIKEGEANYVKTFGGSRNRWGDYNGIAIDPADMSKIWTFTEYAAAPANTWGTWFGEISFEALVGPQIGVSPMAVNFGQVFLGNTAGPVTVTIVNNGNQDLVVSDISDPGAPFIMSNVPVLPLTLGLGETATFDVSFAPTASGPFSGNITVSSNDADDPAVDVMLSGEGLEAVDALVWNPTGTLSAQSVVDYARDAKGTTITLAEAEAKLERQAASAGEIAAALSANGVSSLVLTTLPIDNLPNFKYLFVVLGMYPSNYKIDEGSAEALAVEDFIAGGGKAYMEGGDMWYWDPGFSGGHDFGPTFGIEAVADGGGGGEFNNIIGSNMAAGQDFAYNVGTDNYPDHIEPIDNGILVHSNDAPAFNCGVGNQNPASVGSDDFRTIGASFQFGELIDGTSPATKAELMASYLDFFNNGFGVPFPSIQVSPASFDETLPVDGTVTRTMTISNVGDADLTFSILEVEIAGGGAAARVAPAKVTVKAHHPIMGKGAKKVAGASTEALSMLDSPVKFERNAAGDVLLSGPHSGDAPLGITEDLVNGHILVADLFDGNVWSYDKDLNVLGSFPSPWGTVNVTTGVAFNEVTGNTLFFINDIAQAIETDMTGTPVGSAFNVPIGPSGLPTGIAFDLTGTDGNPSLWYIDIVNDDIFEIDLTGAQKSSFHHPLDDGGGVFGNGLDVTNSAGFIDLLGGTSADGQVTDAFVVNKDGSYTGLPPTSVLQTGDTFINDVVRSTYTGIAALYLVGNSTNAIYVVEASSDVAWLSADPVSGTVSPGTSVDVAVTFDATGLTPGDYNANLNVSSNDPGNPAVSVPAHLLVTGAVAEALIWNPTAAVTIPQVVDRAQVKNVNITAERARELIDSAENSVTEIATALTANGVTSETVIDLTSVDLAAYQYVFVVLGHYPANFTIGDGSPEATAIEDFIAGGGKAYIEGGDTWYFDPLFGGGHDFGPTFGINAVDDGFLSELNVILGSNIADGQNFDYTVGSDNWTDHLEATGTGFLVHSNDDPAFDCSIASPLGLGGPDAGRTIGASVEFGELIDGVSPATKAQLMARYLDFFNNGYEIVTFDALIWIPDDVLNPNISEKAQQRGLTVDRVESMKKNITSHMALQAALEANGKSVVVTNDLTAETLTDYSYVFVVLGVFPNNHLIGASDPEAAQLQDYLATGGRVYIEGGDAWYYDPHTLGGYDFGPSFSINATNDGSDDLKTVLGGCFALGSDFVYKGSNNFIDHLSTAGNADGSDCTVHSNESPSYGAGIAFDNVTAGYRTIGIAFEFGGLEDNSIPGATTKADLMAQYLEFFDGGLPAASGQVTVTTMSESTFFTDCPVVVTLSVDLSETDGPEALGGYNATVTWDPTLLEFAGYTGGDEPFNNPIVNADNAASGQLAIADFDAVGATGNVTVINLEFNVVGDPGLAGVIDAGFSEMIAAGTFNNLLPIAVIEDASYSTVKGCLLGDVTNDDAATVFDALVISTNAVGLEVPPEYLERINQGCGDVTSDGDTSVFDSLVISTYAVGLPVDPFVVGVPFCP